jgi:hypothetical protein
VLAGAARDGVALLSWEKDTFAYADGCDEATGRYRGLRSAQRIDLIHHAGEGLLVRPEIAAGQLQADRAAAAINSGGDPTDKAKDTTNGSGGTGAGGGATNGGKAANTQPNRYYGSVLLDAARVGRDAGKIADEVIAHLSGLVGAEVKVTLEIEARIPNGVPENTVRTVTENSQTLKFDCNFDHTSAGIEGASRFNNGSSQ